MRLKDFRVLGNSDLGLQGGFRGLGLPGSWGFRLKFFRVQRISRVLATFGGLGVQGLGGV